MKASLLTFLIFLFIAGTGCCTYQEPQNIHDLIVLGLNKNIGLQVEKINIPLTVEGVSIESSAFDSEFFASVTYSEQSTPLASSTASLASAENEEVVSILGFRKRYHAGLMASVSLNTNRTSDNYSTEALDPRYRTAVLLDLTQPLLRNFGRSVNTTGLQLSRNQNQQSSYGYFLQAQSLAMQIETLALQLAAESEIVKLRQEAVTLAKDLYSANKKRYDSGVIPISEVQEAETDLANRELNLSLAKQSQELSFDQLNRQLDHSLPDTFNAEVIYQAHAIADAEIKIKLPEFEQMLTAAKQKRLDLKMIDLEIENSGIEKQFYDNQLQPQLDLKLQAGLNGLSGEQRDTNSSPTYTGNWNDSFNGMVDSDGYQWRAGFEFSHPLGNRSAKARYRQAELLKKQAHYRKQDLESALKDELVQQVAILERAAEQFEIANKFKILAEKSLHQEQRRVTEGLSDTFRLILFQNNMINAKVDRIKALTLYHLSLAKLNFSRGIILESHGIKVLANAEEANFETL